MFRTLSWLLALSASVCDHCGCTGCHEQCEHHALLRVHAGISIVAWLRCVLAFARLFPFSRVCARAFLTAVIFPGSVSDGPAAADDLHIVEDHVDLFDVLQRGQFDRCDHAVSLQRAIVADKGECAIEADVILAFDLRLAGFGIIEHAFGELHNHSDTAFPYAGIDQLIMHAVLADEDLMIQDLTRAVIDVFQLIQLIRHLQIDIDDLRFCVIL